MRHRQRDVKVDLEETSVGKTEGKEDKQGSRIQTDCWSVHSSSWTLHLITENYPIYLLNPISFFFVDVWRLENFKTGEPASRIRGLSTCNLRGLQTKVPAVGKTQYLRLATRETITCIYLSKISVLISWREWGSSCYSYLNDHYMRLWGCQ